MRILLFNGQGQIVSFGGSEKVLCNFANEFVRRGCEVGATVDEKKENARPAFPLDSRVRWFNVGESARPTPAVFLAKIWREATRPLRKTFLAPLFPNLYPTFQKRSLKPRLDAVLDEFRPDVVVTFFTEDSFSIFHRRKSVDFATIQMAHNPPDVAFKPSDRKTLDRCDVIQVLHSQYVEWARRLTSTTTPIVVVPNVVPQFAERVDVDERERAGSPRIVCVGRLDKKQKRQHLLLEAFAKIAEDCPNWSLCFFGNDYARGSYRDLLEDFIEKNRLTNRVFLYNSTPKIFEEELKSDIFAFPSAYEGFPLALTEAQALGLPAVGFRSTPSVNELIVDGENGFLANDVDDFAQKLKTLIESKELRRQFGAAAKKGVERFEASVVWDRWEALIRETVEKKRRVAAERADKNAPFV